METEKKGRVGKGIASEGDRSGVNRVEAVMRPVETEEALNERTKRSVSILETIRRAGSLTKADISKSCRLNIVTVSNYLEEFIAKRVVVERRGTTASRGRRPSVVELNPDAGYAIGIGVAPRLLTGALMDLRGRTVVRAREEINGSATGFVQALTTAIRSLIERSRVDRQRILAIGVGAAGLIDRAAGTIHWPLQANSTHPPTYVTLRPILEKEAAGPPVVIDGYAQAAAFGEYWSGLEEPVEHLVYLHPGMGCGIFLNDELYRGASGTAGEVSLQRYAHLLAPAHLVDQSDTDEQWGEDFGIVREARERLDTGLDSEILKMVGGDVKAVTLHTIIEAAKEGDQLATELMQRASHRLGSVAALLVNLLNPSLVVIGGRISEAGSLLVSNVRQMVTEQSLESAAAAVRIATGKLGDDAAAYGAAGLVIRGMFARL